MLQTSLTGRETNRLTDRQTGWQERVKKNRNACSTKEETAGKRKGKHKHAAVDRGTKGSISSLPSLFFPGMNRQTDKKRE